MNDANLRANLRALMREHGFRPLCDGRSPVGHFYYSCNSIRAGAARRSVDTLAIPLPFVFFAGFFADHAHSLPNAITAILWGLGGLCIYLQSRSFARGWIAELEKGDDDE